MAKTLKSGVSSKLDVLDATKVGFSGIGLNLDVLIVPSSEWLIPYSHQYPLIPVCMRINASR